jgi:hypothetical protein
MDRALYMLRCRIKMRVVDKRRSLALDHLMLQYFPCRGTFAERPCAARGELGRTRDWLEASRQGTQNLVDSYTEVVPKALEVLPSQTRHRI